MTDDDLTRKLDELGYNSPRLFLFCKSLLAAGASEGQAVKYVIDEQSALGQSLKHIERQDAEIAALRERIAGMEDCFVKACHAEELPATKAVRIWKATAGIGE